ncbi:MAG: LON peptidase substrate-binding domain-containing protein [Actinomycetota bacterium]|nr:LON peptidase substrate-binding domain-containing protein [Actinomycetota bacterium]
MELPLFPLHVVLFPGMTLPLQVFEPRYREMLDKVLRGDRRFGVIAIRRGAEVGGPAETFDVGCIAEVTRVQRAPDGTLQLLVEGRARFRIEQRLVDDPYPRSDVVIVDEAAGAVSGELLADARSAVRRYLSSVAQIQGSDVVVPSTSDDAVDTSFILSAAIQVEPPDRQVLLEARDAATRLQLVIALAHREALLLEAVGPSVGHPRAPISLN